MDRGQVAPRSEWEHDLFHSDFEMCVSYKSVLLINKDVELLYKSRVFRVVRPMKEMIFLYGTILNITMSAALFSI